MKTPDEIKKGLEVCVSNDAVCGECPYDNVKTEKEYENCMTRLMADALAYIQQLEAERDTAIKDIPRACGYCKHYVHKKTHLCRSKYPCVHVSGVNTRWEWRGVCEENSGKEAEQHDY